MTPDANLATAIEKLLDDHPPSGVSSATLRRCMNETWFSDSLAWVLDPSADHGLGSAGLEAFCHAVAKARADGFHAKPRRYARYGHHLRHGNGKTGRLVSELALGNAASIREFYLGRGVKRDALEGVRYCDLVLLDLDRDDGLFLVVENKLLGHDHPGQLAGYLDAIKKRYGDSKSRTREFAYITLRGGPPKHLERGSAAAREWVCLGWVGALEALVASLAQRKRAHEAVRDLAALLGWMKGLAEDPRTQGLGDALKRALVDEACEAMVAELNRLEKGSEGRWTALDRAMGRHGKLVPHRLLRHAEGGKRRLRIDVLPSASLAVQSLTASGRTKHEKLIVPFGAPASQVLNLIDVTARDVYGLFFGDEVRRRLLSRSPRTRYQSVEAARQSLFHLVSRRRAQVQLLLALSDPMPE